MYYLFNVINDYEHIILDNKVIMARFYEFDVYIITIYHFLITTLLCPVITNNILAQVPYLIREIEFIKCQPKSGFLQ